MRTIVLLALFAVSTAAAAAQTDCRSINDAKARLACFDKAASQPPAKAKKPAAAPFSDAKAAILRKLKDPSSAQWRDLFTVAGPSGPLICGAVNSKNSMGGYAGFSGFIYEPSIRRGTIMMSGRSDPEYTMTASALYCTYCIPDPRSEKAVAPHCPGLVDAARRSPGR